LTQHLVAAEDHAINPELQRFLALRIRATTAEVKSSHVPFVSKPNDVVGVIREAARATAQ
jgi:hypothetical protein